MYIVFFLLVLAYLAITSIVDTRKTKRIINITITEKERIKWYLEAVIWEWGAILGIVIMCLIGSISFIDIGFRKISFEYNFWFTLITLVLSGLFFLVFLYQSISFLVSAEYRDALKEKILKDNDKNYHNAVYENLLIPRTRKDKQVMFCASLTAGICEELLLRGFLFFLLRAIFPGISIILVVIITSVLFGLWHFYQGIQGIIKTFLFGVLYGCLYLATDSIIPGILFHFLLDFSSTFLLSEE